MPRQLFLKFRPFATRMRDSWYFRAAGPAHHRLAALWSVNRRAITTAFGAGIAISFIPLPVHLLLGLVAAMIWRLNMPTMLGTLLLHESVHRGAHLLRGLSRGRPAAGRSQPGSFAFELSWNWLQTGLGTIWKPFLVGCLVCSVVGGYLAYRLLELIWRISTVNRLNAQPRSVREN